MTSKAIYKFLAKGRTTGTYDLTGKGLQQVPEELYNNELAIPDGGDVNWWEYAEPCKLQLSRNNLSKLPPELFLMHTVSLLDLSYNELADGLPEDISQMRSLRALLLCNCSLTCLPAALTQLEFLARIDVSHNQLSNLPELGLQQPLTELLAAHNQLRSLPDSLGSTALSNLDVSHNELQQLPDGLWKATNLRTIDLSYNHISGCLPSGLSKLQKLITLNVRHNQLTALPEELGDCASLVELHVGRNGLRNLPEQLASLRKLLLLDASGNYLTSYPKAACSLKLNCLDLSSNEIRDLPPELGLMESLRALKLEGNPLKSIRQNLLQGPVSALLEFLRSKLPNPDDYDTEILSSQFSRLAATKRAAAAAGTAFDDMPVGTARNRGDRALQGPGTDDNPVEVIIRSGNLTQIPSDVVYLSEYVVKLDISSNKVHTMNQEFMQRAHNLRVLMLPDNKLTSWPLPMEAGTDGPSLRALLHCNMARNPIATIPGSLSFVTCPNLKVLDLSGVPGVASSQDALEGLTSLSALAELMLVRCELQQFPTQILQLRALTLCNLSSNQIEEIPAGISQLSNLHTLDMTNNNLRNLPPLMGKLHGTLRVLLLDGNPLRSIRRTLITAGTGPLLEYLITRIPAGQQ